MQDKIVKILIILIIWFSIYATVEVYKDKSVIIESESENADNGVNSYKNL